MTNELWLNLGSKKLHSACAWITVTKILVDVMMLKPVVQEMKRFHQSWWLHRPSNQAPLNSCNRWGGRWAWMSNSSIYGQYVQYMGILTINGRFVQLKTTLYHFTEENNEEEKIKKPKANVLREIQPAECQKVPKKEKRRFHDDKSTFSGWNSQKTPKN